MARCIRVVKKKREICIGDMRDLIVLQNRAIQPPDFYEVDFTEDFEDTGEVWALVNTVSGRTYFDGVNTETPITHEVFIRYDSTLTAETWIEFNNRRLDILSVENLDERNEFQKLVCNDRGLVKQAATQAGLR